MRLRWVWYALALSLLVSTVSVDSAHGQFLSRDFRRLWANEVFENYGVAGYRDFDFDEENRRLLGVNERDALPPGAFVQPVMVNPFMGHPFFMDQDPVKIETAEKQVLKAAEKRGGELTVQMMALDTDLSLDEAKAVAEHMRKSGYCQLDIAQDGAEVYQFMGLTKKPLVLD